MKKYPIYTIFIFILSVSITLSSKAQKKIPWDDPSQTNWPKETRIIHIKSTLDDELQKAYVYSNSKNLKTPLIVSLHTWGGDYTQRDPILQYCIDADINYIHPDFRGPNTSFTSAGSSWAIQDIDDAIQWAMDSLLVDKTQIHLIGVSGGAFATLMSYMHSKHNIQSFHAFAGMYSLQEWYYESLARGNKYAQDIISLTNGKNTIPNWEEAKKRSPLLLTTPITLRENSTLALYAGLHDGYKGSVPISHTLAMYNKVVNDFAPTAYEAIIPLQEQYTLLKRRISSTYKVKKQAFMGRDIIYQNQYKDIVKVIIFDGGHEMPAENPLHLMLNRKQKTK